MEQVPDFATFTLFNEEQFIGGLNMFENLEKIKQQLMKS